MAPLNITDISEPLIRCKNLTDFGILIFHGIICIKSFNIKRKLRFNHTGTLYINLRQLKMIFYKINPCILGLIINKDDKKLRTTHSNTSSGSLNIRMNKIKRNDEHARH